MPRRLLKRSPWGWHLDGIASAVVGTHTHVQTADERILPQGTAYITDAGMTGPRDSVIGTRADLAIERFLKSVPVRFKPADGPALLCGVIVDVDETTGRATAVERLQLIASDDAGDDDSLGDGAGLMADLDLFTAETDNSLAHTVSEVTAQAKEVLEALPMCWVVGEVSDFARPSSGHCYLTLVDEASQLSCVHVQVLRPGASLYTDTWHERARLWLAVGLRARRPLPVLRPAHATGRGW